MTSVAKMNFLEDMSLCSNFEFFAPMPSSVVGEAETYHEVEKETIGVDELEQRMWKDKMLLKKLKKQNKGKLKEGFDVVEQRQSQEKARRKKLSREQDGILKCMQKTAEVCMAQGFVYGIILKKGKPVSGASNNLRAWWKEKVQFDRIGPPAAICKYNPMISTIKGEVIDIGVCEFTEKRKQPSSGFPMGVDQKIFVCEYRQCPYGDTRLGFYERNSRNNHQITCEYNFGSTHGVGETKFQASEDHNSI